MPGAGCGEANCLNFVHIFLFYEEYNVGCFIL